MVCVCIRQVYARTTVLTEGLKLGKTRKANQEKKSRNTKKSRRAHYTIGLSNSDKFKQRERKQSKATLIKVEKVKI